MTTESQTDPRKSFVPRYWPWLLALAMLGVYWVTLNRWASLLNLTDVARLSGWTWMPEFYAHAPLTWLATLPLRALPASQIPLALNGFSAVCAALALGLLARSVACLPHDRTEAQRLRETSDFSFLTSQGAWLPPVLAVLICGLKFSFWENATNFTGETLELLVFAFIVWSLLEYRLDEREGRLMAATVVFGAGLTQDPELIGFLPLLVGALIWLRGLSFFNAGFLGRMILCGLAGTALYLLLPTLDLVTGKIPLDMWWPALKHHLGLQGLVVKIFFMRGDLRHTLGLISLTTLLPALLPALRWTSSFDRSRIGSAVTTIMFHLIHGVLLFVCVWGAFDPPFGARHLDPERPYLAFYYLAALGVGYYCGYFLVISKIPPLRRKSRRSGSNFRQMLNPATLIALAALTALATAGLIYKNHPAIRDINGGSLRQYARAMTASLPHTGGLLLSDSDSTGDNPRRLYLAQEALAQEGRGTEFVPVDTFALQYPDYHRYLHKKYPNRWPLLVEAETKNMLDPHGLLALVEMLAKTNAIYYLHPSFGYYFEVFYPEPHGLIYQLKKLPEDTLLPRLPDDRLKAENEAFWAQTEAAEFAPIFQAVTPDRQAVKPKTLPDLIMARLHVATEPNYNAQLAGQYYSRGLNFWGVQAQRAKDLKPAAAHFETAEKLNPNNQVAVVNLEFNHRLQAGQPPVVDFSKTAAEEFARYHSRGDIFMANGPFDEPAHCYADGMDYLRQTYLNQAIASFTRVRELVPNHLPTLLSLAELYDLSHQPDRALEALNEPLTHPADFSLNDGNSTELNITAAAAYIQKTNLLRGASLMEKEIARHPDDNNLLTAAAQVYLTHGLYTNALHIIQLKLALTPNDPVWLYGQGYTYMQMADYEPAIASLTRVLTLQTNNYNALVNRALALLNTGKLEAARADYLQLQKVYPKEFRIAYGLGDIAWRQHDTNAAILNYTACLANAPTNLAEFKMISQRLADLKGKSH